MSEPEPYAQWAERQRADLLAEVRANRARQRRWTRIGFLLVAGTVAVFAARWETLTAPEATRGQLLAAYGWAASLFFLALVAGTVAVHHLTRVRDARYLLALLGDERGQLIRNIVDPQTGKPAVEVDRGLWAVKDGEVVRVEPPETEATPPPPGRTESL